MINLPPVKRITDKINVARSRYHARHAPSGYEYSINDSIHFVKAETWDYLVTGRSLFFQRSYLELLEAALPSNVTPRYVVVYAAGAPVAALIIQLVDFSLDHIIGAKSARASISMKQRLKKQLLPLASKAARHLQGRMVVCGNLFSWGDHGICAAQNHTNEELWPAITEAMYRIRRAEKLSGESDILLIKDLTHVQTTLASSRQPSSLSNMRYQPVETDPNMMLTLRPQWKNHSDYVESLDKKYKKSARQIFQGIEAQGLTVEQVDDLEPIKERLYALYKEVQSNNALCIVSITADYLVSLKNSFKDHFKCTVIKQGDIIVGFVTTLRDGNTAIGYYIGFDRAVAERAPLYLRLLHAVVSDSIELGCSKLSLGRTALEPKARLGAKPEKMFIWTRHKNTLINLIVKNLSRTISHAEAPERDPFKST
jgi:hypothetical protein